MDRVANSPSDIAQKWGFDRQVCEHKQSINFTQNLIGILQEKCELQSSYARGLNRLSTRLREALTSAPIGTVHTSWSRIGNVLESEAKVHQSSALGLLEGLVKPWIDMIEELVKSRKPLKYQVEKATNQLLAQCANELRAKKKLNAAYRACERTWYSHVQSLRSPEKTTKLNGSDLVGVKDPDDAMTSPSPIHKNQLHSYHSFRDGSVNHTSNWNTLDVADQIVSVRRNHSARSATLPSPTSTIQSSDSSGILSLKTAPAVNKTKEACYTALCDYYKACMSAEEARVEWHTVVLKCLYDQRALERQRLHAMVNGLTVYQRVINEAISEMKTMATEITDALRQADPAADVDAFRQRSHDNPLSLNETDCSQAPPSCQTNSLKPTTGIVGRSQQRLLELPGEKNMLQHLLSSRSGQPNGDFSSTYRSNGKFSLDRSPNRVQLYYKDSRDFDLRGHLRKCLTRECLFDHLDLLAKDIQKERRTKRGLSNLVQVYSLEPAYADAQTLTEVRRRLFVSRVRLTHLTNCRQKLLYSLICALPSSKTASDVAPKHIYVDALNRAGFINLPWTIVTSPVGGQSAKPPPGTTRWILMPDLDDESSYNKLTKPLEWPPFPVSELLYEDLNDDLFDWEVERLRLLDADERENGHWNPIHLPDLVNCNLVTHSTMKTGSSGVGQNHVNNLLNPSLQVNGLFEDHQVPSIRPSPRNKLDISPPASKELRDKRSSIGRLLNCDSLINPENRLSDNGTDRVDANHDDSTRSKSPTLAAEEQYESNGEEQAAVPVLIRRSVSSGRTGLFRFSLTRFRRSSSVVQRTQSFTHNEAPRTPMTNEHSQTTAKTSTINAVEGSTHLNPVTIEYDTTSHDSQNSFSVKQNRTPSLSSKLWFKFRSSARDSKEGKLNEHSLISNSESQPMTSAQLISELTAVQRRRRDSKEHFMRSRDNTPSRRTSAEITTRTVHFGSVDSNSVIPKVEYASNRSVRSSNLSLHCVGWAKVEQAYTAKEPDELTLLEGDVVSIYRKENSEWWYGEVNGSKGRFPSSHVDEF